VGGERREEREMKERTQSTKEMERKVEKTMENLKILNLRFEKVSEEKVVLLKKAEKIIKRKVGVKDRKKCEWILRQSKVYIIGKGTVEKDVGKEKIFTVPVLVKCGSQLEKERLERMLRGVGVGLAEMLDCVDHIRGKVLGMGY
jgi:hypothetical protein